MEHPAQSQCLPVQEMEAVQFEFKAAGSGNGSRKLIPVDGTTPLRQRPCSSPDLGEASRAADFKLIHCQ
jgi:hypothetical protein